MASLGRTEYMWDLLVQTYKYEFYQNASPETLQTIGDVCDVGATFFDYLGQVLDNTSKISGQVAKVSAIFTGGFAAGGAPLVLAGPAGGAVYTGGVALGTTVTAGSTIIWCGSEALAVVSNGVAGNLSNEADKAHAAAEAKSSSPNPNGKRGCTAHQEKIASIKPTETGGEVYYEVQFKTPDGAKSCRFADAIESVDGEIKKIYQVGKVNQNGMPVSREMKAINDIMNSPRYKANPVPIYFIPYNDTSISPIIFGNK